MLGCHSATIVAGLQHYENIWLTSAPLLTGAAILPHPARKGFVPLAILQGESQWL
jgi:hypothetical protein